jgi:hypothetical protein
MPEPLTTVQVAFLTFIALTLALLVIGELLETRKCARPATSPSSRVAARRRGGRDKPLVRRVTSLPISSAGAPGVP